MKNIKDAPKSKDPHSQDPYSKVKVPEFKVFTTEELLKAPISITKKTGKDPFNKVEISEFKVPTIEESPNAQNLNQWEVVYGDNKDPNSELLGENK